MLAIVILLSANCAQASNLRDGAQSGESFWAELIGKFFGFFEGEKESYAFTEEKNAAAVGSSAYVEENPVENVYSGGKQADGGGYPGGSSDEDNVAKNWIENDSQGYSINPEDPEWVMDNPAPVAPEDVNPGIISPLDKNELALLENVTVAAEEDRIALLGAEVSMSEGMATAELAYLGIHPRYYDNVLGANVSNPGVGITVRFFRDGEECVGQFDAAAVNFTEDRRVLSGLVNFTDEPNSVAIYVSGEEISRRKLCDIYSDTKENISIVGDVFRPTETSLAFRMKNEDLDADKSAKHYYRAVIYKNGEEGKKEFYSDTYLVEVTFDDNGRALSPKYSIANLTEGVIELRSLSGKILAEKEFKF